MYPSDFFENLETEKVKIRYKWKVYDKYSLSLSEKLPQMGDINYPVISNYKRGDTTQPHLGLGKKESNPNSSISAQSPNLQFLHF